MDRNICAKILLLLFLSGIQSTKLYAQTDIVPLKLGDVVPDFVIGKLINTSNIKQVRISDFKGKLLILDFWSTWCTTCMAQFPKIAKLRQEFENKVEILPVGFDLSSGTIYEFINKWKGTNKELKMPTVLIDVAKDSTNLVKKYFPFTGLPHLIWIDANGILKGITDYKSLTATTIQGVIDSRISLTTEKKLLHFLTSGEELLIKKEKSRGFIAFGSAFSGIIDTLSVGPKNSLYQRESDSQFVRFYGVNLSLIDHFVEVYKYSYEWVTKKRTIIADSNGSIFYTSTKLPGNNVKLNKLKKENRFCYELVVRPSTSLDQMYVYMKEDLDRFFGIKSRIERKKIDCLALVKLSDQLKFPADKYGIYSYQSMDKFIEYLNARVLDKSEENNSTLIINETNYNGIINISIPDEVKSIPEMRLVLREYGLDLIEVEREMDVLVLYI